MEEPADLQLLIEEVRQLRHLQEKTKLLEAQLRAKLEEHLETDFIPLYSWAMATIGRSDAPLDEMALAQSVWKTRLRRKPEKVKNDPVRPKPSPGPPE